MAVAPKFVTVMLRSTQNCAADAAGPQILWRAISRHFTLYTCTATLFIAGDNQPT